VVADLNKRFAATVVKSEPAEAELAKTAKEATLKARYEDKMLIATLRRELTECNNKMLTTLERCARLQTENEIFRLDLLC
jgi:hypothetical protein